MNFQLKPLCAALLIAGFLPLTAEATSIPVTADAHLANINAGSAQTVNISASTTGLLNFDLSPLPTVTSAQVAKATLFVYVKTLSSAGKLDVSPVTSSWVENTVNNSTAPTSGTPVAVSGNITQSNTFFAVDVTSLVQDWIDTPASNFGLALTANSGNPAALSIDSKEAVSTSHPAYLEIVLENSGPQGPAGTTGDTGPQGPAGTTGATGSQGPAGATGSTGPQGPAGTTGATGPGVPTGGSANQVLSKIDGTNYNTQWVTPASGSGIPVYDNSGTAISNVHIVTGKITGIATSGGSGSVTFSGSAIFSSAPVCVAAALTSAGSVSSPPRISTTTTSLTVFNTNTAHVLDVSYHCIGN